ncbi:hypothetical protein RI367_003627 [Sorochytrium milnesiophthora]
MTSMQVDENRFMGTKKRGRGFQQNDKNQDADMEYETYNDNGAHTGRAQKSVEGWIIVVTNVHEETTEEDMQDTMAEYGAVKNLHLNLDRRTGFVKGYALVEYEQRTEALAAIQGLNGQKIYGKAVEVDFAFARTSVQGTARIA